MRFSVAFTAIGPLVSLVIPLVVLIAPHQARADAACDPGDTLIAENADNIWCRRDSDYRGSAAEKSAGKVCLAKNIVKADQNAIRQLGFATDTERFEMFEKVSADQRKALVRKVAGALIDNGLDAVGKIADSAKSLNPWNVNRAVKMLEGRWYGNPLLVKALRKVARVKGKPEKAAAYEEFARLAKSFREGYQTGQKMREEPDTAQLQLLAGVLKTLQGNYELGLVVTGAEFGESLAYLGYVGGQVDALARASDGKLAKLPALTRRLKTHVDDLVDARQNWRRETGIPVDPICTP